jgi:hypothetical protein
MNLCKTCRFWVRDQQVVSPFRKCSRGRDLSRDDFSLATGKISPSMVMNEFGSCDSDNYESSIITGSDFGCVLHEPTN